jgi:tripartite-type tricarboxylate transporter receptor subunit TctC
MKRSIVHFAAALSLLAAAPAARSAPYLSHTSMNGIPYKGSAAAYPDLVSRRVDFMVDQPVSSMSFVQNGKLRVLAVTSEKRWPQMPDVPTVAEQGFPEFSTTSWWAVIAPAGTPADVVARINASVNKSLRQKSVQDTISQLGADVSSMTLQQAQAFTAQELGKWRGIADAAHVKLD